MTRVFALTCGIVCAVSAGSAMAQSTCDTYTVKSGDTLAEIAQQATGSALGLSDIVALNQDVLRGNPDLIFPGMSLKLSCETGGVPDAVVADQRAALAASAVPAGFGPQSPRDLSTQTGSNKRLFNAAPDASEMNLCNIHFHENAEHRGGQFTTYAGNGDGKGYGTGFKYDGTLSDAELTPISAQVGSNDKGSLEPGDTIEIHFVHTSAQVTPGPTLGACLNPNTGNPQLRVETVVAVLVNDPGAADMVALSQVEKQGRYFQAPNIPDTLGSPIQYAGSTTGPSYNEKGSPFQVSWSVRPNVLKLDITSVDTWLKNNRFDEKYAHGVRNLVVNPDLISSLDN